MALEAACRALSTILSGSSALGVIAAAAALPWISFFLTWLRLLSPYSICEVVTVTVEVAERTTSVVRSTVTVAGNDVLHKSVFQIRPESNGATNVVGVIVIIYDVAVGMSIQE